MPKASSNTHLHVQFCFFFCMPFAPFGQRCLAALALHATQVIIADALCSAKLYFVSCAIFIPVWGLAVLPKHKHR